METPSIHGTSIFDLTWFSNNTQLISVGADRRCLLYDISSKSVVSSAQKHTASVKSVSLTEDSSVVASGGRDGSVYFYDPRKPLSDTIGHYKFTQNKFGGSGTASRQSLKYQLPSVTGLAFFKQHLLCVIESHSDRISFLDLRKMGDKAKMCVDSVDNYYFKKTYGDPCTS